MQITLTTRPVGRRCGGFAAVGSSVVTAAVSSRGPVYAAHLQAGTAGCISAITAAAIPMGHFSLSSSINYMICLPFTNISTMLLVMTATIMFPMTSSAYFTITSTAVATVCFTTHRNIPIRWQMTLLRLPRHRLLRLLFLVHQP